MSFNSFQQLTKTIDIQKRIFEFFSWIEKHESIVVIKEKKEECDYV